MKYLAIIIAMWPVIAVAGEISKRGAAIEVESYRCQVTGPYSIQCQNIGRVCEAFREKEKQEMAKRSGCGLKSSPNYPCEPWDDTVKRIKEGMPLTSTCTPMTMGAF